MKKVFIGLVIALVAIQFIKPAKNNSGDESFGIQQKYNVPAEVKDLLKVACNDCHSNTTEYPWYADYQPVAWFLDHHVQDGKKHLNFSEFLKLPVAVQNHKWEETAEMIEEKEMPLESYTFFGLHAGAKLSDSQRKLLVNWAHAQMDSLKANYPADSLVLKRRKKD